MWKEGGQFNTEKYNLEKKNKINLNYTGVFFSMNSGISSLS